MVRCLLSLCCYVVAACGPTHWVPVGPERLNLRADTVVVLRVQDTTGRPIPGAAVQHLLSDTADKAIAGIIGHADTVGTVRLPAFPAGNYRFRVFALGYQSLAVEARVETSGTVNTTLTLRLSPFRLIETISSAPPWPKDPHDETKR